MHKCTSIELPKLFTNLRLPNYLHNHSNKKWVTLVHTKVGILELLLPYSTERHFKWDSDRLKQYLINVAYLCNIEKDYNMLRKYVENVDTVCEMLFRRKKNMLI